MFNRTGNARFFTLATVAIMALAAPTISSAAAKPDTAAYTKVLERFVTDDARVQYASLKANPADLDGYLKSLDYDWSLNEAQGD